MMADNENVSSLPAADASKLIFSAHKTLRAYLKSSDLGLRGQAVRKLRAAIELLTDDASDEADYRVVLTSYEDRMTAIKAIRLLSNCALERAVERVDAISNKSGVCVFEDRGYPKINKRKAQEIINKLMKFGIRAEMKLSDL